MSNALKLLGVSVGAALVACQSLPPADASLEEARLSYAEARGQALVARAAPLELDAAREALELAQKAWADQRDPADVRHLAYVATQRVTVARLRAAERAAQERLQTLSRERAHRQHAASVPATNDAPSASAAGPSGDAGNASPAAGVDAAPPAAATGAPAASLRHSLDPLQARPTPRGFAVNLPHSAFEPRSATLTAQADAAADRLARTLEQATDQRLLVEAFTADVGDTAANVDLSQARAAAFAQALERHGVMPSRFETRGLGPAYPVADNATRAGRLRNERLELLLYSGPDAPSR